MEVDDSASGVGAIESPMASGETADDVIAVGSRTRMPRVCLERFSLAAATRTEIDVSECDSNGELELCLTSPDSLYVVVKVWAAATIARPLDIVVVVNDDMEYGYGPKCAIILTSDDDGHLRGTASVRTSAPRIKWSCERPKPLKDVDGSLSPIISTSVGQENLKSWVTAARNLPKEHSLRIAIRRAIMR